MEEGATLRQRPSISTGSKNCMSFYIGMRNRCRNKNFVMIIQVQLFFYVLS